MKATILAVVVLAFSTSHAFAVSMAVKLACKDDYFAHCSHHAVGSPGVRQCMRDVGPRLSSRCIGALADAGMIKGKTYAKASQGTVKVAAKATPKKQYAKKAVSKKQYAQKASGKKQAVTKKSAKQRYASKPGKTQHASKASASKPDVKRYSARRDEPRRSQGRSYVAMARE